MMIQNYVRVGEENFTGCLPGDFIIMIYHIQMILLMLIFIEKLKNQRGKAMKLYYMDDMDKDSLF